MHKKGWTGVNDKPFRFVCPLDLSLAPRFDRRQSQFRHVSLPFPLVGVLYDRQFND
jgi:hypothetical protein